MKKRSSRSYLFWDSVNLLVDGLTDRKDPLFTEFSRFEVDQCTTPDLHVLSSSRLQYENQMLLPENRGFFTSGGLGWKSERGEGIFLEWPGDTSGEWTLRIALEQVKFPQFRHFLDMRAVGKGIAAVHGSAVSWRGSSVLAAGPPKAGKTLLISGFLREGGELVGDDWLWARSDSGNATVLGLSETIELSPENLDSLIDRRELSSKTRRQYWAARLLERLASLIVTFSHPLSPLVTKKAQNFGARQKITLSVEAFRSQDVPSSRVNPSPVSHCFLVVQCKEDDISLQRIEKSDMARRLSTLNRIERSWMYDMCDYTALAFEKPGIDLGAFESIEKDLFQEFLRDVDCFLVSYPAEVNPERLRQRLVRQVSEDRKERGLPSRVHHG